MRLSVLRFAAVSFQDIPSESPRKVPVSAIHLGLLPLSTYNTTLHLINSLFATDDPKDVDQKDSERDDNEGEEIDDREEVETEEDDDHDNNRDDQLSNDDAENDSEDPFEPINEAYDDDAERKAQKKRKRKSSYMDESDDNDEVQPPLDDDGFEYEDDAPTEETTSKRPPVGDPQQLVTTYKKSTPSKLVSSSSVDSKRNKKSPKSPKSPLGMSPLTPNHTCLQSNALPFIPVTLALQITSYRRSTSRLRKITRTLRGQRRLRSRQTPLPVLVQHPPRKLRDDADSTDRRLTFPRLRHHLLHFYNL